MDQIKQKELSNALTKALKDEHLWSRDAAQLLNINPVYVNWMLNPKYFDKPGSTAWKRVEDWAKTGDQLSSYKFPEGEEVWQPKKQEANVTGNGIETLGTVKVKKEKKKKEKPESESLTQKSVTKKETEKPALENSDVKKEEKKTVDQIDPKIISAAADMIWLNLEKMWIDKDLLKAIPAHTLENTTIRQAVALDIEINLVVNGQRVKIA